MSKRKYKTIAVDAKLHKELKLLAVRKGMDLADLTNRIVEKYLHRNPPRKTLAKGDM